ncbi:MAG: methyltransferase domain-containing protein [Minwuia sp.]|nr:methyltransferase domain-containing protein [Minwuia sp.]
MAAADRESKSGILGRLAAWWDSETPRRSGTHSPFDNDKQSADDPVWPHDRVKLVQRLFGDGLVWPGGEAMVERMLRPLEQDMDVDLDKDSRIVELGAGLGGIGARLSMQSGATVTAFDDRVGLIDHGVAWVEKSGASVRLDRRELHDTGLRRGFADAVIARDSFMAVRRKKHLFDHIFHILKPTGKLVYTDLFLTGDDPECPEVAVWSAMEPRPMHLMNPQAARDMLYDIGFAMPDFVDITDAYLAGIREAFGQVGTILQEAGSDAPTLQPLLVAEAEYWTRRSTLMESGEVRAFCVTANIFQGGDVF